MREITGIGILDAIAIGKIIYVKKNDSIVTKKLVDDTASELALYEKAKKDTALQMDLLYAEACQNIGEAEAQIFAAHKMLLEDIEWSANITSMIEVQKVNAPYAIVQTANRLAKTFAMLDDVYMQARAIDIRDVAERLIENITSTKISRIELDEPCIICADDLSPSETASLDKDKVLAFVTKRGTTSTHTAILAKTMGIPAIVDCGEQIDESVHQVYAIVDGFTGKLYLNPDEEILAKMQAKKEAQEDHAKTLLALRGQANETLDGKTIDIFANITSPDDMQSVMENDAGGVGLFRSEFLYMERDECPSEEVQYEAYCKVLSQMNGKRVIIRTLDLGADKRIGYLNLEKEENPALGYRAIRICLTKEDVFKVQLRALLRASVHGNLSILLPMITSVAEVVQAKEIIEQCKKELAQENIPFADHVEIGIMVETPAAALIADRLAEEVDFFSIGTNDLTQYALALDRQNPKLEIFYDAKHEAVLRLIDMAVSYAHEKGKRVGICGELAADCSLTRKWIEMGIDSLSVAPTYVLGLRAHIRELNLSE